MSQYSSVFLQINIGFISISGYTFFLALLVYASSMVDIYFYHAYFLKFPKVPPKSPETSEQKEPVSVIVCLRNEIENLGLLIPALMDQDYPEFEIILVADRSDASTLSFLHQQKDRFGKLKVLEIKETPDGLSPKKYALGLGIQESKHSILLFTDADCLPVGNKWISTMASFYASPKIEIVLGYGGYKQKSDYLNLLIRFDTLFTAAQYMGLALAGKPYMGVGRNLSYRKVLFEKNGGFGPHLNVLAGDDDLFVNRVANPENTAVCLDPESFTISVPKENWSDWVSQKSRHFSVSSFYKQSDQLMLLYLNASRSIGWILLMVLFLIPEGFGLASFLLVHRFLFRIRPLNRVSKALKEDIWVLALPLLDFVHSIVVFAFAIQARFSERKTWM